jgi:DNA polymerase-4
MAGVRVRWIIHADLDAFFAAAEVIRRPELAGVPLIVGGTADQRGVVSTASYAARVYGVRSAMPVARALRLCPALVILPPDFAWYRALSARFHAILDAHSPLVEAVGIDEAYLDASDSGRLFGGPEGVARSLKQRVSDELGLSVSLGVATNRLVAKIASDLDKPDGLRVVPAGAEAMTLAPLAIERLPGIGPKAAARLRSSGIETLGELASAPGALLRAVAGADAQRLRLRARGEDDRPVRPEAESEMPKSVGHEQTFSRDLRGRRVLEEQLYLLCEQTGAALRRQRLVAATVMLKLRYGDFSTVTRQQSLAPPTDAHQQLFAHARLLLERALREREEPIRLLGVRASALSESAVQLRMFDETGERTRRINVAIDEITRRAGAGVIGPARFASTGGPARRG